MPSTTPAGSRTAMAMQPGLSDGITSPAIWVVRAAASRTMPTASIRLKRAQPSVAPISPIIASTKAAALESRASAALVRKARRALGPRALQPAKAAWAASAAACAWAMVMAVEVVATAPVTGFRRSKVAGLVRMSAVLMISPFEARREPWVRPS
jgi:hypothetical protein